MAESKRRGEDAVDERLDEELDDDALEDAPEDEDFDGEGGSSAVKSKPRRSGGVDKSPRPPSSKTKAGDRPGMFARLRNFFREVISELGKVIWPTRKELLTYTAVVIVFVAIIMTIVGLLDTGFAWLVLHVFGTGKK